MKRIIIFLAGVVLALTVAPAEAATNTKIPIAPRFQPSSGTLQAIVVSASTWHSTYATVTTWYRSSASSAWVKKGSGTGRVGYNGIRIDRLQNSGTTPAGMFGMSKVLTPALKSGVKLPQKVYTSSTYWVYDPRDPSTYNTIQEGHDSTALWRTSEAERLMSFKAQYNPAVVINYNLPPNVDTSRGGGIFLHVNGSGATAGCVSLPYDRMGSIARWLDPARKPVIIIGKASWLNP
jgi:L,D-peptidoglycan transpeptidase YkuD (ErfK/YbiS/YcfS/YnhG family)